MTLVKQLSIAITADGEIGDGNDLLFTSNRDFANFSLYTAGAVMIMGFNTAQQMHHKNVYPTAERPWVIVSGDRKLKVESAHAYYVDNLPQATTTAEDICGTYSQLLGWTLIGGIKIFETVIEALARNMHLTSYYLCQIEATSMRSTGPGPFLKLSKNAAELELLLQRNMIDVQTRAVYADVVMLDSKKEALRASCTFKTVTDKSIFDNTGIDVGGPNVIIETSHNGVLTLPFQQISGFTEEHGRDEITVYTKDGRAHRIRLESGKPGLAFLKQQLTIILAG